MYSELDDVVDRKQPTAPAPAPAPDDNYSLARYPGQRPPKKGAATSASVYSLAQIPEDDTPKYFILEEQHGKMSSGDDQGAGGQYFILEERSAGDEIDGKKLMASQGEAVTMHGAHEYSSLTENRDDNHAEYTSLSQTFSGKAATQGAHPSEGQNKEENTGNDGDRQYFILEEEAVNENGERDKGGQYFILEEDAAEDEGTQGGEYFILEEGAADENGEQDIGGQYFILEEDAAKENREHQHDGQYFILEEGAATMDDDKGDAADPDREYSHLDHADRGDNSSDRKNEYTPIGFLSVEDPSEKATTNVMEYFQLESYHS
nr:hypothetical protein BaRGS_006197 [Batillaria attramentaria]